jgi:hypothetical protein
VIHITEAEYREADENGGGWCLSYGDPAEGVEPDACEYKCEACGARQVYGASECMLMGRVMFTDVDDPEVIDTDNEEKD